MCGQVGGAFLNPSGHHKVAGRLDKMRKGTDILSFHVFTKEEGTVSSLAAKERLNSPTQVHDPHPMTLCHILG